MPKIEFNNDFIHKFIKFGVVGISGIIVDFGITYLFKEKLKVQKYVSNSLGFIIATISNYLLNETWTFNTREGAQLYQFGKFFGFAIIGLILSNLLVYFFTEKLKFDFYVSKIFAIAVVSLWNFFANYLYTFAA